MVAPPNLLRIVGATLVACLLTQVLLGWVLGVTDAWVTVTIAAALLGGLVIVDARGAKPGEGAGEGYDPVACTIAALAVVAAVACLYLPMPWGGLAGAAIVAALVVALALSRD